MDYTQRCTPAPLYDGSTPITSLYTLKLVAAFIIVLYHLTMPLLGFYFLVSTSFCIFPIITGYFLPNADGSVTLPRLRYTIKKLLRLTITAQVIYILLTYIHLYIESPVRLLEEIKTIHVWVNLIFVGDCYGMQLWSLSNLLFALIVLYLATKWGKTRRLIIPICIIFSILGLLCGEFRSILPEIEYHRIDILEYYSLDRTCLGLSLPLMLIGIYLRRNEHKLPSMACIVTLLLIIYIVGELEASSYQHITGEKLHYCTVMTYPMATMAFIFMLKLKVKNGVWQAVSRYSATHSTDIYLWHGVFFIFFSRQFIVGNQPWISLILLMLTIIMTEIIVQTKAKLRKKKQK